MTLLSRIPTSHVWGFAYLLSVLCHEKDQKRLNDHGESDGIFSQTLFYLEEQIYLLLTLFVELEFAWMESSEIPWWLIFVLMNLGLFVFQVMPGFQGMWRFASRRTGTVSLDNKEKSKETFQKVS